LEEGQKPRILIVQYSDKGGEVALNVPSGDWIQTKEAELAGALPVWQEAAQGGGWTVVNLEQVAAWDPEKVFVISYKADSARIADRLAADPQWQALKAVHIGQVYGYAGDIYSWDQPDPRWILGTAWLAGKVHPDRFATQDTMQEASQFFEQMYGLDEKAFREQIVPTLKGDVQ
jgi:iron complex transport system substrate-binding protein